MANIHDAAWGAPQPAPAKADSAAATKQFCGPWTSSVGFLVTIGYVAHVLLGWSARVRSTWDWQLDQWRLSAREISMCMCVCVCVCATCRPNIAHRPRPLQVRDLPGLVLQTHPVLCSTDTALYEVAADHTDRCTVQESGAFCSTGGRVG